MSAVDRVNSFSAYSPPQEGQRLPTYSDFNKVMANGITYQVIHNCEPKNKVMIKVVLRVGSRHEEEHELGIAHLLEHVAFLGTKSFSAKEIREYFQSIGLAAGADHNAFTGVNSTEYHLMLPNEPEHIEKCLKILYEMIFEMSILPEEVEKEKRIVLDEKGRIPEWRMKANRKMLRLLYPGQKFEARLPIGSEECILAADAASLRRFYEKWYKRTDLIGVFVVGDIDQCKVEQALIREFEQAPAGEPLGPLPLLPRGDIVSKISVLRDKSLKNPQVSWMAANPDSGQFLQENRRSSILDQIIQHVFKYRLYKIKASSIEYNFVYSLKLERSSMDPNVLVNSLSIGAENNEKCKAAISLVFRELRRLRLHGVEKKEFENAISTMRGESIQFKANLANRKHEEVMTSLAASFTGMPRAKEDVSCDLNLSILDQTRLDDLAGRVAGFFHVHSSLLFAYLPKEPGALTKGEIQDLIESEERKLAADLPVWDVGREIAIPEVLAAPGALLETRHIPALKSTLVKLENGIEILVRPVTEDGRSFDLEGFHPFFRGGLGIHESRLLGCALAAFKETGFCGLLNSEISEFFSRRAVAGAFPVLNVGKIKGSSTPETKELLLQVIHHKLRAWEEVRGEEFEKGFQKAKELFVSLSQLEPGDQEKVAERSADLITQGSPYYQHVKGEEYASMTLEEAKSVLSDHFPDPTKWKFTIVGQVGEIEELLPLLCKYLGSLESRDAAESRYFQYDILPRETWSGEYKYYDLKNDRAITRILFKEIRQEESVQTDLAKEKIRNRDDVLSQIARQIVRTHIMEKIRREERLLYGTVVGRKLIPLYQSRLHSGSTGVNYIELNSTPDEGKVSLVVGAVKDAIFGMNTIIVEELLSGVKELLKIRNRDLLRSKSAWASTLLEVFRDNLEPEMIVQRLEDYESNVDSIGSAEVLERIRQEFDVQNIIVQSHFPKEKATPE